MKSVVVVRCVEHDQNKSHYIARHHVRALFSFCSEPVERKHTTKANSRGCAILMGDRDLKITSITIQKELVNDDQIGLVCRIGLEDGTNLMSVSPWINTNGLWASDQLARQPAEIAATLRCFAKAIDQAAAGLHDDDPDYATIRR